MEKAKIMRVHYSNLKEIGLPYLYKFFREPPAKVEVEEENGTIGIYTDVNSLKEKHFVLEPIIMSFGIDCVHEWGEDGFKNLFEAKEPIRIWDSNAHPTVFNSFEEMKAKYWPKYGN